MSGSGGNYPPSYHLQSPQGYVHPRHRLPIMPPHRAASYGSPNISQAHMSQSSPWTNKHTYSSNYHEATSPYYASGMPRDYAAAISHFGPEDAARWAANQPFINAAAAAAATMGTTNPYEQLEKLENRLPGSTVSFLKGMQQESMDLSSSHMNLEPPAAHSSIITTRSDLNGEVSRRTALLKNPLKLASASFCSADRMKSTTKGNVEVPFKKETVSVIAENPIRDKIVSTSNLESYKEQHTGKSNESTSLLIEKENKQYGDSSELVVASSKIKSKEESTDDASGMNVIPRVPIKIGDNLTVVKLPPTTTGASTGSSNNVKNLLWQNEDNFIKDSKYSNEKLCGIDVGKSDKKTDVGSNLSKQPHIENITYSPPYIPKSDKSLLNVDISKPDSVLSKHTAFKSNDGISDNVELRLENMFHIANSVSTSASSTTATVLQSSVIVSNQTSKVTSTLVPNMKGDFVEKMLKSPSPVKSSVDGINNGNETNRDEKNHMNSTEEKQMLCTTDNQVLSDSSVIKLNEEYKSVIVSEQTDFNTSAKINTDCMVKNEVKYSGTGYVEEESKPSIFNNSLTSTSSSEIVVTDPLVKEHNKVTVDNVDESKIKYPLSSVSSVLDKNPNIPSNIMNKELVEVKPYDLNNSVSSADAKFSPKQKSTTEISTPKSIVPEKDEIVKVETQLEKLFAGIMDTGEKDSNNKNNTKTDNGSISFGISNNNVSSSSAVVAKRGKEKPKNQKKALNKINKNLKKKEDFKEALKEKLSFRHPQKDTTNDTTSSKLRVPTIRIMGSKENPTSWTIINNCSKHHEEDDASEAKMSFKKKLKMNPNKKIVANYNHSKAHDIGSADESWICMFCKLGPYCPGADGDPTGILFGPYFVTVPDDQPEEKKRGRKVIRQPESVNKKKKRSLSCDDTVPEGEKKIEVWAHFNCIVWTCGIHLIGSSLLGLEDAVRCSMNTKCDHCGEFGASMGCQIKNCKLRVHYSCGVLTGWELNPDTYSAKCRAHSVTNE